MFVTYIMSGDCTSSWSIKNICKAPLDCSVNHKIMLTISSFSMLNKSVYSTFVYHVALTHDSTVSVKMSIVASSWHPLLLIN